MSFWFKILVGTTSDWQSRNHGSKSLLQRWLRNRLWDLLSFDSGEWDLPLNIGDSPNRGRMFRCWLARTCTPSSQPSHPSLVSGVWTNQHPLIHLALGHRQVSEAYKSEDQEVGSWESSRTEAIQFIQPCRCSLLLARWHFFLFRILTMGPAWMFGGRMKRKEKRKERKKEVLDNICPHPHVLVFIPDSVMY